MIRHLAVEVQKFAPRPLVIYESLFLVNLCFSSVVAAVFILEIYYGRQ